MKIEELLNCSADELEKLSDSDLEAKLAPYLIVTRPELAHKESYENRVAKPSNGSYKSSAPRKQTVQSSDAYKKAQEIAKQFGLKI